MGFGVEHFIEDNNWLKFLEEEPELLIEYLEKSYRPSLWIELPALIKVVKAQCQNRFFCYPQLEEVLLHLQLIQSTFRSHTREEAILFEMLKRGNKERGGFSETEIKALKKLISLMEEEHQFVLESFKRIRGLCAHYKPPLQDVVLPCLYGSMKKCENLILEQIYLESKLLFEKIMRRQT